MGWRQHINEQIELGYEPNEYEEHFNLNDVEMK
jgi:hypothetical protein